MMKNFSIFILLLCLISVQSMKKGSENSDVFVPSKEWKTVKKGKKIKIKTYDMYYCIILCSYYFYVSGKLTIHFIHFVPVQVHTIVCT
jgi:hypothetical protein